MGLVDRSMILEEEKNEMMDERPWEEFRKSGLLWLVNRMLHVFGWSIVVELEEDKTTVIRAFPARVKYRGFTEDVDNQGFVNISTYMEKNSKVLLQESMSE